MRAVIAATLIVLTGYVHPALAQIYSCTASDGSRVFSDKRCGPDAKLVKDIGTKKRIAPKASVTPVATKSSEELQLLLKRCNEGDEAACMTWSKGGGPKQLRALEKEQEASCDGGSLSACEQRYCRDGASDECKSRVKSLATVSGESWYLRFQKKLAADGPAIYSVRCLGAQTRDLRDFTVSCAAVAGPSRCQASETPQAFPRLDAAASNYCAVSH
ncbi:MAG: hypothetical protein ACJ8OJ_19875 [Povalibacter sp.]